MSIDTLNKAWKEDKSRFGYQMLLKMGWKEDKGLGKEGTGTTSHIKVKKRHETLGLGMEQTTDSAGMLGWNNTASSFNNVLETLKLQFNNKKDKKSKKKDKTKKSSIISVGIK